MGNRKRHKFKTNKTYQQSSTQDKFGDTKWVTSSRKSKIYRQYNGQKKTKQMDKQ